VKEEFKYIVVVVFAVCYFAIGVANAGAAISDGIVACLKIGAAAKNGNSRPVDSRSYWIRAKHFSATKIPKIFPGANLASCEFTGAPVFHRYFFFDAACPIPQAVHYPDAPRGPPSS
jgi:hypothetical protein